MSNKVVTYLKNTRAEMEKVKWPTQRQTTLLTGLVVAVSFLTAAYLGVFDFILSRALEIFIL